MRIQPSKNQIVYLATFPPRECGIATFTYDLTTAFDQKYNPVTRSRVVAVNDAPTAFYNYGKRVAGQITATNIEDYVGLAKKINGNKNIKVVSIQHEFGIFGGEWGDHLIPFLQVLEKPIITTLHSVLPKPDEKLLRIVQNIAQKSKAVVVMNELSQKILSEQYGVPKSKIFLIPHGITPTPFESPDQCKKEFGLEGKLVLSTFGLLSRGKGIEYAIRAVKKISRRFPNVVYLILGETHPVVRKEEGEAYRNFLMKEVERLGLKNHVKFYNKYMTLEEKINYLKATDVYISPTLGAAQSVSGTLSDALGCGRPVVSTATAYAKFIVTERNGRLVPFKNSNAIAKSVIEILEDEKMKKLMSGEAYENTRKMTWPNVATAYFNLFKKFSGIELEERKLPLIKLDHLKRLTDSFGILHHAKYSKPSKRYGYTLDDNARALIVCAKYYQVNPLPEVLHLIKTYLRFIKFSERPNGGFSKTVDPHKHRDHSHDDDVLGRGVWALGYLLAQNFTPKAERRDAERLFHKTLSRLSRLRAPRAIAFAMTGLYYYLKRFQRKNIRSMFLRLAKRQIKLYESYATQEWQWFEDHLAYSNSKLPESLLYAYAMTGKKKYLSVAEKTLEFLTNITYEKEHYAPIGQNGWYFRNKRRSYFDQQPEDAASMVETKIFAYRLTGKKQYLNEAYTAFQWFLGKNHLNLMVYDETTGGCHDGLGQHALNLNEGAEATLSYLLARLAIEELSTSPAS